MNRRWFQSRICVVSVFMCMVLAMIGCAHLEYARTPVKTEIQAPSQSEALKPASPPLLPSETAQAATPAAPETLEPLDLTLENAIVMALENNHSLVVQSINPAIRETSIAEQRAVFDLTLVGNYAHTDDRLSRDLLVKDAISFPAIGTFPATTYNLWAPVDTETKTRTDSASMGISQTLPTGTDVSLSVGPTHTETRGTSSNPFAVGRGTDTNVNDNMLELSITQKLLRGAGLGVNLASLRQARLDKLSSEYELRGFAESLVSQVEQAYWDFVLAQRQIGIYEQSLAVAQSQADEVTERIKIGRTPETERTSAEAEVALRKSSLIDAHSTLDKARLTLLVLINPKGNWASRNILPKTEPVAPSTLPNQINESIALAKRMRYDLNQARLLIKSDKLELVKTKNGLLPQLDLFVKLGQNLSHTGYTDAIQQLVEVTRQDLRDERNTTEVGVTFSYPIGNRAARARDQRAGLMHQQDQQALANMTQLVEQDVRKAYVEIGRSYEQIAATAATRRLQEQTCASEIEKNRIGRSNQLLVAQAQRDLLSAQIGEVQAMSAYLKSIVDMYRLDGSLLERRGIACPGREPVVLESE